MRLRISRLWVRIPPGTHNTNTDLIRYFYLIELCLQVAVKVDMVDAATMGTIRASPAHTVTALDSAPVCTLAGNKNSMTCWTHHVKCVILDP
ncbi:MAG: hypothetical protein WBW94_03525 [Anaerolineales bacterium]